MEESLARQGAKRESRWTESIAVGSKAFVEKTKEELGTKAIGREVIGENGTYELRDPEIPYGFNFTDENVGLRPENMYFWNMSA